ncbi:MAG TPA: nuclear transport factor 2 family protein [Bryobacteraceae bacterium]|jgi:ketosteroid isomerase-like protein|nr:nuclear transport factor 2 family protein [Bryobacteraceae bacterium]
MSSARKVLDAFFDCLRNLDRSTDRVAKLFADEGVFEFPYLPTLGLQSRYTGPSEIRSLMEMVASLVPSFTLSKIDIYDTTDPNTLFVEYHSEGTMKQSGTIYAQDYISKLAVEDGKIKSLREYLDVISSARAILPNGLADVPAPKK